MTSAAGARNPTTGLTPGLTVLTVGPAVKCAWCGAEIERPRRNQRFCSPNHRQRNYDERRTNAPAACYTALVGLTLAGLATWDELPPLPRVMDAFDVVPAARWGALMTMLGQVWVSEERTWKADRDA